MEVRTKGREGNLHKTARVFTNDPNNAHVIIGLMGKVWAPISLTPKYARLTGSVGDKIEEVVRLRGEKKEPLMVKLASVSIPDKLEVELNRKELRQRLASLPAFKSRIKTGYLKRYSDKVSSASAGAVFTE